MAVTHMVIQTMGGNRPPFFVKICGNIMHASTHINTDYNNMGVCLSFEAFEVGGVE